MEPVDLNNFLLKWPWFSYFTNVVQIISIIHTVTDISAEKVLRLLLEESILHA